MSISLVVDVSNIYFSLKKSNNKLSYSGLVKFAKDSGKIIEMHAIVVHDPTPNSKKFVTMLKKIGFIVTIVPNCTSAQLKTITLTNNCLDHCDKVFICTNAICPLYELKDKSSNLFVICRDMPEDFVPKYNYIEIPPSLTL